MNGEKEERKERGEQKERGEEKRDADIENGHVDTVGGGEGGTNWEMRIDIYTLPCVKQTASGKLLYSTGSSARCSVVT